MSQFERLPAMVSGAVVRYCQQHAHPINAPLHMVAVPMLAVGLYRLATRQPGWPRLIIVSYALQWIGHSIHGTEVGEVTLIKKIWRRVNGPGES